MSYLIGKQIDHYQIEALLGEGGMASVYRAFDLSQNQPVAFKIMHAHLAHQAQFQERFAQESQAVTNFNSPAIIKVSQQGVHEGIPYLVMEYLPGGSLTAYLKQLQWTGKRIALGQVVTVGTQVAEGLSYAHQRGLIHRDIKPDNVLLKLNPGNGVKQAVIADFGLAMLIKDAQEMATNPFMGSLPYMSPEQCANMPLDGRSDIYSLGIVLYQLSTGQLPFKIDAPADIVKHLQDAPLPPRLINPDLPESIENVILKALAKKPGDRYQTGAELAHALRQIDLNEGVAAVAATMDDGVVTQWIEKRWLIGVDVPNRIDVNKTWITEGNYRLLIAHPWEESRIVGVSKKSVTIGRQPGNDIVLNDKAVSGQHVRLERTETGWQVSDLGSTNGTFLDSVPVEFNKPREWLDDQTLQVGSYSLRWQSFAKTQRQQPLISWHDEPPPPPPSSGPQVDIRPQNGSAKSGPVAAAVAGATAVAGAAALATVPDFVNAPVMSSEGDVLGITITPSQLEVMPGAETFLELSVQNLGATVEDIFIRVEEGGLPVAWMTVLEAQAKLLPNEVHTTTVTAVVPQDNTVRAGSHTYQVIATTSRSIQEVVDGSLMVAAFEDFTLDMHPRNLQEKVTSRLSISDRSNFDNKYVVNGTDDSDALLFEFDEPSNATLTDFDEVQRSITVPAGTQGTLGFRVKPKKRPWFRTPTSPYFYKVRVRTDTRDWQTLEGQLEVKPRISRGAIIFFILLLLLLGLLGYWAYTQLNEARFIEVQNAEATASAIQATADAVGATATAAQSAASSAQDEASAIQLTAEALAAAGQSEEAVAAQATADALQATADALQAVADQSAAEIVSAQEELAAAQEELAAAQEEITPTPVPPPTDLTLDNLSVAENSSIGSTVGSFAASSAYLPGDDSGIAAVESNGNKSLLQAKSRLEMQLAQSGISYTYELASGTGDDDNGSFFIDGDVLKTAVEMDYETQATYSIRVETDNGFGGTFAKQFTILVDDENDTPALTIADVTVNENAGTVVLAVEMTNDSLSAVSVDYATSDSTALAGDDYTGSNGTLTWQPGETGEKSLSVTLVNDELDEQNETFNVTLSNAEIGIIEDGSATVTIVDDDDTPTITIEDVTVTEGGAATVAVTLAGLSSLDVTVSYASNDVSATSGSDYTALNGTLTWAAGETGEKILALSITDDVIDELTETFNVVLAGPLNATLEDGIGEITITDNDPAPTLSIQDIGPVQETGNASITVIMSGESSLAVTVNYATSNGTATAGSDYTAASGTLTWSAGSTGAQLLSVAVLSDILDEPDETFNITLSNATNATIADDTAVYTITDDDATPSIELLGNVTVGEGDGSVIVEVRLNGGSSTAVSVDYITADGTADSGDYNQVLTPATLTWAAGQVDVVKTIEIVINDDPIDENDETFSIALSNNSSNASILTGNATVTISDNDTAGFEVNPLTLSISEPTGSDTFNVRLLTQPTADVVVPLTSGTDCSVPTEVTINSLTWSSGVDVTVTAVNDDIADGTQTCTVTTGDPTSSDLLYDALTASDIDNVAVSVLDDDVAGFTVTPLTLVISEPTGSDTFNVQLTSEPTADVTVPLSANTECTLSAASAVLTAANWDTGVDVTVTTVDDAIADGDQPCPIITGNPTSSDTTYNALGADDVDDVAVTVEDDDSADIIMTPLTLTVTEPSSSDVINISLNSEPLSTVSIEIDSNDMRACTLIGSPVSLDATNWDTGVDVTVTAVNDDIDDGDQICLAQTKPASSLDPNYNNLDADDVTVTVVDDDTASVTVTETGGTAVTEGGTNDTYTIVLNSEPTADVVLTLQASTNVNDIQLNGAGVGSTTAITFTSGTSGNWDIPQTVTVAAIDDFVFEGSETSIVTHTATSPDTLYNNITIDPVSVTITDNDVADVTVTQSGGTTDVTEDSGGTDTYQLVLTSIPTATVLIMADPDDQLDLGAGKGVPITVTFQPIAWNVPQTVTVTAVDDTVYEQSHTGTISHTSSSSDGNYNNIAVNSVTANIADNDGPPELSVQDISVTEGDSGSVQALLTVDISNLSTQSVSVDYVTGNGSARHQDGDYDRVNPALTLTWPPGNGSSQVITLTINGDTIDEGVSENFFVDFSMVTNATMSDPQAEITITDDDDAPTLAIADATVIEQTGGTSTAVVTVTMMGISALPISVDYSTSDDVAVAGSDYTATANTLNWAAGDNSPKFINVSIATDSVSELDETFFVDLSNAINATISAAQATVTIVDDDLPTLSIADSSIVEGTGGTTTAVITVTVGNGISGSPITVDYDTADDTAVAGPDYNTVNGTLSWPAGDVTDRVISIPINPDGVNELDETFFVDLSNPSNAAISDGQGVVTIVNDDPPSIAILDAVIDENVPAVVVTVIITGVSSNPVTVDYASADGTAVNGFDYLAVAGTFTWNSGDASVRTVNIPIINDPTNEYDETFLVNLSNVSANANVVDSTATVTIVDNDLPAIAIADVVVVEGTGGTTTAVANVLINGINSSPITVDYATADDTAADGSDYTGQSGTFTWNPGDTTPRSINIPITTDSISELDETFFVNLTNPVKTTLLDNQAIVTILNDDIPTLAIQDVSIDEGTGGTTTAVVTVAMTGISANLVTVAYSTADDTATLGTDYLPASGTLVWAPTDGTPKTFNVPIIADDIYEPDETFFANLTAPTNAIITDNQATVTIANDDALPVISIDDVSVGETGGVAFFIVSLANPSSQNITVDYATANDTATAGSDYTAASGTANIAAGSTTAIIPVSIIPDPTDEIDETFNVNLSGAVNASIGDNQGVGTIIDDDGPIISISNLIVTEINGTVQVTVTLSASSPQDVSMTVNTTAGTATAGTDYQAINNGSLTIPAGSTTGFVQLTLFCQNGNEPTETLFINLSAPVNATIGMGTGLISLEDDGPGNNC